MFVASPKRGLLILVQEEGFGRAELSFAGGPTHLQQAEWLGVMGTCFFKGWCPSFLCSVVEVLRSPCTSPSSEIPAPRDLEVTKAAQYPDTFWLASLLKGLVKHSSARKAWRPF